MITNPISEEEQTMVKGVKQLIMVDEHTFE